jgi:hypothetical protein
MQGAMVTSQKSTTEAASQSTRAIKHKRKIWHLKLNKNKPYGKKKLKKVEAPLI